MTTLNFTVRMFLSPFVHKRNFLNFASHHLRCTFTAWHTAVRFLLPRNSRPVALTPVRGTKDICCVLIPAVTVPLHLPRGGVCHMDGRRHLSLPESLRLGACSRAQRLCGRDTRRCMLVSHTHTRTGSAGLTELRGYAPARRHPGEALEEPLLGGQASAGRVEGTGRGVGTGLQTSGTAAPCSRAKSAGTDNATD